MRSKFSRNVRKNSRKTRKQYGGAVEADKIVIKAKKKEIIINKKGNEETIVTITEAQIKTASEIFTNNKIQYVKDRLFVLYDTRDPKMDANSPLPIKKIQLYHLGNKKEGEVSHGKEDKETRLAFVDYGGLGDRKLDSNELKMFAQAYSESSEVFSCNEEQINKFLSNNNDLKTGVSVKYEDTNATYVFMVNSANDKGEASKEDGNIKHLELYKKWWEKQKNDVNIKGYLLVTTITDPGFVEGQNGIEKVCETQEYDDCMQQLTYGLIGNGTQEIKFNVEGEGEETPLSKVNRIKIVDESGKEIGKFKNWSKGKEAPEGQYMIKVTKNPNDSLHLVLNYNESNLNSEYQTKYDVFKWQDANLKDANPKPFETPADNAAANGAAAAAAAEGGGRLRRKRSKRNSRRKTRSKRNSRRKTKRKI